MRETAVERGSPSRREGGFKTRLAAGLIVLVALLAWLWPIGIGGKMPVGGDVTAFFLGLMGFYADSLRDGRLPVWNDLWGYGFPGLAESQMGVFYPPHVLLYGGLSTETAYVASLVLHTLWGGLGAFWASRRMGVSGPGSALAAFTWAACGFFLVHLAHPWGYTTGCWMPWAWGLAWSMLAPGSGSRRGAPFRLSLVLVLQVLPGHFQLAFQTQVLIGLMIVWAIIERRRSARRRGGDRLPSESAPLWPSACSVVAAVAAVYPLAALQLGPTARLAELAGHQRDFEYLSGFASTPFHLVNYVAPGLFHRSPLWRPLVWDPFHTSPEEELTYIGLVPLFLAALTLVRESRRDPAVRLLTAVTLVTLLLSLGPYTPGFRYLIAVPGFSFFRAPARWSLGTALTLALLAGKGFDGCREWPRLGRSLRGFVIAALAWIVTVLGLIELSIHSTKKPARPEVVTWFDRAFKAMPWADDRSPEPREPGFEEVLAKARQPVPDPRVPSDLSLAALLQKAVNDRVFTDQRWRIYAEELGETAALLLALWILGGLREPGRARSVRAALLLIAFLDLWALGRHPLIDLGPIRPLASQSPVLARLAEEPRGTRIAGHAMRNLPMLEGLAPILAYRTLTLPTVEGLTAMAVQGPMSVPQFAAQVQAALWATGASLRVFTPVENRVHHLLGRSEPAQEAIEDPALAGWIYGASWTADLGPWVRRFAIWHPDLPPARAWLVPWTEVDDPDRLDEWSGDPREILALWERAEPLESHGAQPEEWTITVPAVEPAWVIVTQLADPQWSARWIGLEGQGERIAPIRPTFRKNGEPGGWQRVEVPGEGLWTLRLEYDARDIAEGTAVSTLAWAGWLIGAVSSALRSGLGRLRRRTHPQPGPEPSGG